MDQQCESILTSLNLPQLKVINLELFETRRLRDLKKSRTHGEYCWTLTPFLIEYVLHFIGPGELAIYVDADCWFLNSPKALLNDFLLSGSECMITPHSFPKGSSLARLAGTYCVQFMPFRNTDRALEILHWWQEACSLRCSSTSNGDGLGDQGHLEHWPRLFGSDVFILSKPSLTLAPWNLQHLWNDAASGCLCMYHFQGFRLYSLWSLILIRSSVKTRIPTDCMHMVFRPYINDIIESLKLLQSFSYSPRSLLFLWRDIRGIILFLPRVLLLQWKLKIYLASGIPELRNN